MPATNNDPLGSNNSKPPLRPWTTTSIVRSHLIAATLAVSLVEITIVEEHRINSDDHFQERAGDDKKYVERFDRLRRHYYLIVIHTDWHCLSVGSRGLPFRQCLSNDSALFVNLPLNCFRVS
jgi:hypothetical protein